MSLPPFAESDDAVRRIDRALLGGTHSRDDGDDMAVVVVVERHELECEGVDVHAEPRVDGHRHERPVSEPEHIDALREAVVVALGHHDQRFAPEGGTDTGDADVHHVPSRFLLSVDDAAHGVGAGDRLTRHRTLRGAAAL
ncbi:MAG TPA: hypothetical protein VNB06_07620 [Thermoanaerobaculia bacterium]|nr:hypothetical protein [Thermoanaerobaculia bacterium]